MHVLLRAIVILPLCATGAAAQAPPDLLRATGEHRLAPGDTAASASALARVDGEARLHRAAIDRLRDAAAIAALRLTPEQLDALVAALIEPEPDDPPPAAPDAATASAALRTPLDVGTLARQLAALRKDQYATQTLLESWREGLALQAQLAAATERRREPPADRADAIARDQVALVARLDAKRLSAQATAAAARTVERTTGGRVPSTEGRERAQSLVQAALALDPDSPDALSAMGDLLVDDGQVELAEAAYRRAIAGRTSPLDRVKLAEALRLQGRPAEAAAELRAVIDESPSLARAHTDLGLVLTGLQREAEAMAAYREAIRLDPDAIDAHNGLAVALARSGQIEEAVAAFREIIRVDPDSAIGYYNLAYALAELDRDVEAAAALRAVIRINPEHYNARFNLGELFRLEGKYDDSAAQFREYLRLVPDTPQHQRNIQRARGYVAQFGD